MDDMPIYGHADGHADDVRHMPIYGHADGHADDVRPDMLMMSAARAWTICPYMDMLMRSDICPYMDMLMDMLMMCDGRYAHIWTC